MLKPLGQHCLAGLGALLLASAYYGDASGQNYERYHTSKRLRPDDYLMKSFGNDDDSVFGDASQIVDLGVNLNVGSDCGRVNFEGTMRSTLKNLLDSKYFGDLGKNIVAASPMLLTCYMSPTWCAILKHSQVSANFLSQMRLDQCAIIDKYTDSRSDDYYRERQDCVRKRIDESGGDLESAMGSCQNVYDAKLNNWAGPSAGEKSDTNKLLESSAKWAGISGAEGNRTVDLLKSFVGETIISKGNLTVDYGPKNRPASPLSHLNELRSETHKKLCSSLLSRLVKRPGSPVEEVIGAEELDDIAIGSKDSMIDLQTIEALSLIPDAKRESACRKLSNSIALSRFTSDVNRSIELLAVATQNPNLPPERKSELEEKRKRLKESVDLTLELERQRNEPMRDALREVNAEGERYRSLYTDQALRQDESAILFERRDRVFLDCSDGLMCSKGD